MRCVNSGRTCRVLLSWQSFLVLFAISLGPAIYLGQTNAGWGMFVGLAGAIVSALVAASIKVANQWERGLVLRLGQFQSIRGPGMFFVVPIVDRVRMVDTRVLAADIPRQEAITKDNVPVSINGALFFKVVSAEDAVMKIQDYVYGISLLAQTALRDVVGGMVLDELLSERERIGKMVEHAVENDSKSWGLHVTGIRLMDIDMPEDLKRIMSRQAVRSERSGRPSRRRRGIGWRRRIWRRRRRPCSPAQVRCNCARYRQSTDSAPRRPIRSCWQSRSKSCSWPSGSASRLALEACQSRKEKYGL